MNKGFSFAHRSDDGRNSVKYAGKAAVIGAIFIGHLAMATVPAKAEPRMVILEYPLEATKVLSLTVNRAGRGSISLSCGRCQNNRIRLSVNPESRLTINGVSQPLRQFRRSSRDLVSAFYREPDGVLTRLVVTR